MYLSYGKICISSSFPPSFSYGRMANSVLHHGAEMCPFKSVSGTESIIEYVNNIRLITIDISIFSNEAIIGYFLCNLNNKGISIIQIIRIIEICGMLQDGRVCAQDGFFPALLA